jgi:hypothetical protein
MFWQYNIYYERVVFLNDDKWIAYLLIGMIAYTLLMIYFFEHAPSIADQINSSVIIGLLFIILIKVKK